MDNIGIYIEYKYLRQIFGFIPKSHFNITLNASIVEYFFNLIHT